MRVRVWAAGCLVLGCCVAMAKGKKVILPADVLSAHTVLVLVEPDAGVVVEDPRGNQVAQDDVEKALIGWGRLVPVMQGSRADLVITVRKGHGRLAEPTIGGTGANNRPAVLGPIPNGGRVGVEQGTPDASEGAGGPGPYGQDHPGAQTGAHPQMEVGSGDDEFVVYRGDRVRPLDGAPVWRYSGKNALHSPDVPAVAEFRKAVDEAEKQMQKQP